MADLRGQELERVKGGGLNSGALRVDVGEIYPADGSPLPGVESVDSGVD